MYLMEVKAIQMSLPNSNFPEMKYISGEVQVAELTHNLTTY